MKNLFKKILALCREVLFPKNCVCCHALGNLLCSECVSRCSFYNRTCRLDLSIINLPVYAATYLDKVSRQIITEFKYAGICGLAPLIAQLIYEHCYIPTADIITFVPLHSHKKKKRGFNQAELLAQELSRILKIPCVELLIRTQEMSPQAQLKEKNLRLQNTAEIYTLSETATHCTKDKRILIIDDVCTTGATLGACGQVLNNAGFKQLAALVIAHGT